MTQDTISARAAAATTGSIEHATAAQDDALMVAYVAGDASSFEVLYRRHKGPVYRFFLRQLAVSEAEECHQEVWLKVIRNRDAFTPQGSFSGWLFTIAHRVLADRHRAAMRRMPESPDADPDTLPSSAPDLAVAADQTRLLARLYRLIAGLPIAQREALLLREEAGLSLSEIASVTQTSEEGVKSRLRYAMQKLRSGMNP